MVRHNHLCDVVVDFCQSAHLSVSMVEKGLTRDLNRSRPADHSLLGGTEANLQHLMSQ